jgi:Ca-activated chloride channel family protein
MRRWHLTVGLSFLVLGTAILPTGLRALVRAMPPEEIAEEHAPVPEPRAEPTALHLEAGLDRTALLAGHPDTRFVVIDVTSDAVEAAPVPVDVAIVLDSSCSMQQRGKLDYARAAAKRIAAALGPEDTLSVVTFDADARTLLPAAPVLDRAAADLAIDRVRARGGTNLYGGLVRGGLELGSTPAGRVKRVVVLSDGEANIGFDRAHQFEATMTRLRAEGVATSTLGLGHEFNEDLLSSLADLGGGSYHFVSDPAALADVFTSELGQVRTLVARNTTATLALPADVELVQVVGWPHRVVPGGASVDLGDFYAGEKRKVVVEVRVDPGAGEARDVQMEVATVHLDYDVIASGGRERIEEVVPSTVTRDPAEVTAGLDVGRRAAALSAWSATFLEQSSRAYAKGAKDDALRFATRGREVLAAGATETADPALAQQVKFFDETVETFDRYAPLSDEGRTATKAMKAESRDWAR